MPARERGPSKEWLTDRLAEGMTDREMAERWTRETGVRITRQGITARVRKFDLRPKQDRCDDLVPWKVKEEHDGHWYQRLLRAESRIRRGQPVSPIWKKRVERFKKLLEEKDAVVAYVPDSPKGFYLVKAKPGEELITLRRRGD